MAFTTLTTVKKHLLNSAFGALHMEDHPVTLWSTSDVDLPHHNITSNSVLVKRWEETEPEQNAVVVLTNYDWISLADSNLVPDSIAVASSEALSSVYAEEKDFQIDYAKGKIRRIPGTVIPHNTAVLVWYSNYKLFSETTDYVIDTGGGKLHRTSDSSIPDGGTVFVDYDVNAGSVQDDLISEAITEVEDVIVRNLSPGYSAQSTDQGLKTGACWLAVSVVCRALASDVLSRADGSDAGSRGKEFQQLSERYEAKAWRLLQPFVNTTEMRSPVKFVNE